MAVVVEVSESNGVVETVTDGITQINFGTADLPGASLVPIDHPLTVPLVATNSFAKWLRVHLVSINAPSSQINNLQVWRSSGTIRTQESMGGNVRITMPTANGSNILLYGHCTQSLGGAFVGAPFIGNPASYIGNGYSNPVSLLPGAVPGAVNLAIANSDSTGLSVANTYSNYMFIGEEIGSGTPTGLTPGGPKVISFQYDEL